MRLRFSIIAFILLLAACTPMQSPVSMEPMNASSALPIDTATGELDITPEPFADPLAPASMTGAVHAEERSLSGSVLEIGSARARLTMDVFVNTESVYAREFVLSRLPHAVDEFVSTGRMKMRFYAVPIAKYPGSEASARTLLCATRQGKGYAALMRMMEREAVTLDKDGMEELALDAEGFASCAASGDDPFTMSRARAAEWGVTLVPTYVIDGEVFTGLPTQADLEGAIRAAL